MNVWDVVMLVVMMVIAMGGLCVLAWLGGVVHDREEFNKTLNREENLETRRSEGSDTPAGHLGSRRNLREEEEEEEEKEA